MRCVNSDMYADQLAPWFFGAMLLLGAVAVGIGIRILVRGRWVISADASVVLTGRRLHLLWTLIILAVGCSAYYFGHELLCSLKVGG